MKCNLTLQEKLIDQRCDKRKWTLAEVAKMTNIPISTLHRLESDSCPPRISHEDLMMLARLYGVSTDYLFGLTDNLQHRNIEVDKLQLSDEAIEVLINGKLNNRLISEFLAHPDFPQLLNSMEIYIDRKITPQIGTLNGLYKLAEETIREKFTTAENDEILAALQDAIVDEDEFLRYRISERFNIVIKSLFDAHKKDALTAEQENVLKEIKDGIQVYFDNSNTPANRNNITLYAKVLGLDVSSLTDEEINVLLKTLSKSEHYKRKVKKRKII